LQVIAVKNILDSDSIKRILKEKHFFSSIR
jgi:hypothetical protein